MADKVCLVCGLALKAWDWEGSKDAHIAECLRCGLYEITGTLARPGGLDLNAASRAGLSAALRDATRRGQRPLLTSDSYQRIAEKYQNLSISQKLRRLLEYIGEQSQGVAGTKVQINGDYDYPLFAARDQQEYHWLRQALFRQGLIGDDPNAPALSVSGWEEVRPSAGTRAGTCFVAMAFDASLDPAFDEGIRPAIETDCGLTVTRVDRVEHNDNINDRILADLRACQFVVADFTLQRGGVYFEAGFALGLGRPVVFTCRRDDFKNAHFDTRPYNHLLWGSPVELREKLRDRIQATIIPR